MRLLSGVFVFAGVLGNSRREVFGNVEGNREVV
jgi:hypothetical protein